MKFGGRARLSFSVIDRPRTCLEPVDLITQLCAHSCVHRVRS